MWIARASVLRCVPLSPWIRIGKSKSARCLACAIRFWTESAWDRESEKVREEAKKVLSSVFSSFGTDISVDLPSGRNARKTGSVSGKTIERTLNVICVF